MTTLDDKLKEIQEELNYVLNRSTDCEDADHFKEYTPKLIKLVHLQRDTLKIISWGTERNENGFLKHGHMTSEEVGKKARETLNISWEEL